MTEKIAILVDSGSDVSQKLKGDLDIYSLPLRVTIDGKGFIDGVDITAKEIYSALDTSQVMSSLPGGNDIDRLLIELKEKEYTHVLAVTISSGLSGTYNVVRLLSDKFVGLTIKVIDTLNISLGSGNIALEAARMVKNNASFRDVVEYAENAVTTKKSKVFFTVGSLEYLRKGGRIGLVAGTVANVMNIKPVISCNDAGVYYTVTKIRGFKRSIQKMIEVAAKEVEGSEGYTVTLLNADISEDLNEIMDYTRAWFPQAKSIELTSITPALGIHTGPEALGIAVYKYE